ncbi:heavy-metal-associated domain-containing protein [Auraticoccus sp. F435]|uniref:Heavy-metal-associated domain-containing protein n=1 Tax=Auraticoccus cholistanensis TaxID=2656650 RepID=A0A6A9V205_9ACTN|nr:heavy-metal-associated domain-containing protein [Auraticoccus cholistanensis]MVA77640.1 heavy-metal-associated domain-containing protein [Auraticoccus cholistanensis]
MRAPLRLGLYALVLLAVFGAALGVARVVAPSRAAERPPAAEPGHGGTEDHTETAGEDHAGDDHTGEQDGHGAGAGHVPGVTVSQDGYRLTALDAPAEVGVDGQLSLRLVDGQGHPVTDYEVSHEKELHLVVVRSDGEGFRHVHPRHDGEGTWSLPWRWQQAGSHRVYADFVPAGGEQVTLTSTVEVAGELEPVTDRPQTRSVEVDGLTVTVAGELRAARSSELTFTVERDGRPVTTLQPHLGAFGHLVALREGDLAYLHVHPLGAGPSSAEATSGPEVVFAAEAPTPGRYLLYLDLRVDDRVVTAPLVVEAR